MAFEYDHVHSLHYGFSLPAVGWQYHKYVYELCAGFPFSLGFALYGSAVAGSVWVLWHLRRETVVVLAFAVPFFAILAHWTFVPLRYQLPVLVVGAALAGMWQAAWLESASRTRQALAAATVLVTGYLHRGVRRPNDGATAPRHPHRGRALARPNLEAGAAVVVLRVQPVPGDSERSSHRRRRGQRGRGSAISPIAMPSTSSKFPRCTTGVTSAISIPRLPGVSSVPRGREGLPSGEAFRRRLLEPQALSSTRSDVRRLLHLAGARVLCAG